MRFSSEETIARLILRRTSVDTINHSRHALIPATSALSGEARRGEGRRLAGGSRQPLDVAVGRAAYPTGAHLLQYASTGRAVAALKAVRAMDVNFATATSIPPKTVSTSITLLLSRIAPLH